MQPAAALQAGTQFDGAVSSLATITAGGGIAAASTVAFAQFGAPVAAADTGLAGQLSSSLSQLVALLRGIGQDLRGAIEGYVAADKAVAASLGGGQQSPTVPPHEQAIPKTGTRSAGITDYAVKAEMELVAAAFRARGWTHAADLLSHYLDNTGTNASVDPSQIMKDVPSFNKTVTDYMASQPPGASFDSGWHNANTDVRRPDGSFGGTQSSDWFYAMHDFRYKVTGTADSYTVDVYKPYIFGGPNRAPLTIPHTGIQQSQDSIQGLHDAGLAQDFIITGSSHFGR
ncbi:MAG: hypothetical protein ACR2N4_11655 [Jatrophihabitans sp.]